MRSAIFAFVLLAAGCDASVDVSDKSGHGPPGGYTLEVRADQGQQTYIVTAPDGKVVAALAANGESHLLEGRAVQALANQPMPAPTGDDQVSFKMPGLHVEATSTDNPNGEDGDAHVTVNVGGRNIEVSAQENGPGDSDDRAHVRITGENENGVRDFIDDADELSAETKSQMLAALGIDAAPASEATTATTTP